MKKEKILNIKSFPIESYKDIALTSLVVYSIDSLEGREIQTSFENICMAAFRSFPKRFSLVGFDNYPDARRVNRSLLQCRPKYQNLAVGTVEEGFILTKLGEIQAKRTAKLLSSPFEKKKIKLRKKEDISRRTIDVGKKVEEILNSNLYKKFSKEGIEKITKIEFYDFLGAGPYTSPKILKKYFADFKNIVLDSNNKELGNFSNLLNKKFSHIFRGC